jgi:hypothetical protein
VDPEEQPESEAGTGPPTQYELRVPPELEGGVFANFLGVWHTAHEFTLDFAATLPTEPVATPDGPGIKVPCRVTARIKVPPTLVFEMLKALNLNMTGYEERFGEIRRLGPEVVPPPDQPYPPDPMV